MHRWIAQAAPLGFALLELAACGSTPPPQHASSSQHRARAAEHERTSAGHEAEVGDDLVAAAHWKPARPRWRTTRAHRASEDLHQELAAQHRRAGRALDQAEREACAGLDEIERGTSPFHRLDDLARIEPLYRRSVVGPPSTEKIRRTELAGAIVRFRAVPGLTAEYLQRIVDCHLARNAALGHDVPEMPECPLVPRGAVARAASDGSGFLVTIEAEEPAARREIWRRAARLRTLLRARKPR